VTPPPALRVGVVGYGVMGKAHCYGYRVAPMLRTLPVTPVVTVMSGRNGEAVAAADGASERGDFAQGRLEDVTVYCVAGAYAGSGGFSALRASVAGITAAVETAVQGDTQNPYQNPGFTDPTWKQLAYSDGLQVFVPFRIVYKAL